jgi:hypothetical protein
MPSGFSIQQLASVIKHKKPLCFKSCLEFFVNFALTFHTPRQDHKNADYCLSLYRPVPNAFRPFPVGDKINCFAEEYRISTPFCFSSLKPNHYHYLKGTSVHWAILY